LYLNVNKKKRTKQKEVKKEEKTKETRRTKNNRETEMWQWKINLKLPDKDPAAWISYSSVENTKVMKKSYSLVVVDELID